jgi:hypothetical protein
MTGNISPGMLTHPIQHNLFETPLQVSLDNLVILYQSTLEQLQAFLIIASILRTMAIVSINTLLCKIYNAHNIR